MQSSWDESETESDWQPPQRGRFARLARPALTFTLGMAATFTVAVFAVSVAACDGTEPSPASEAATSASTHPTPPPAPVDEDDAADAVQMEYRGVEMMLARFEAEVDSKKPRQAKRRKRRRR